MRDLFEEAGITPQQAVSAGRDLFAEAGIEPPTSVSAGRALNSIPRQIGLTARYGLEGLAQAAQVGTEPIRYLTDRLLGTTGQTVPLQTMATRAADAMGLPSPEGANERVIGDAARMMAGAGGMAGGAQALSRAPGMVGNVLQGLAAKPLQQTTAAAGAGLAGGASRESGGDGWAQAGASLLGGVAGGMAPGVVSSVVNAGRRAMAPALTPQQIDAQLTATLERAGTDYATLPDNVRRSLRTEMRGALQAGKELDADAVRRLADFRTVGATPTRGMVTLDPVQITREQNLAKMAANSADDTLSGLPLVQNRNNSAIIGRLNDLGGRTETDPIAAGRLVTERVREQQAALRAAERQAWDAARTSPGYTQPIYPDGINAANRALGEEAMMPFMSPAISRYMEAFQVGPNGAPPQPFTPQAYRNLQSMLSNEISKGGNEGAAARIARNALESSEMRPITNPGGMDLGTAPVTGRTAAAMQAVDGQAGDAIEAVNRARGATRAAYAFEDSNPLVRSVLSGGSSSEPEKIASRFVINGTVGEARDVAAQVGDAGRATIRDALATFIKREAVSGSSDEVGKVSQSKLNGALRKIGEEKLRLFFTPEEITQLHATGRVASYMQAQPAGSAVNNSNSGALVLGRGMDLLNGVAGKIPFGRAAIVDPLRNINLSISSSRAQDVMPGLLRDVPASPMTPGLLLPGLAVGGGLLLAP